MTTFRLLFLSVAFVSFLLSGIDAEDAEDVKVLVIGGGPAGIQAVDTLRQNGIDDYIMLEPTDSLRGYLKPVEFGGKTFAPGFIWGYTPIKEKLEELDIPYKESDYGFYVIYNEDGEDITAETMARVPLIFEAYENGIASIAGDIENGIRPDLSMKALLARGGWVASTDLDQGIEWYVFDFTEGVSTQDLSAFQTYNQSGLFPEEYIILDDRTLAYPLLGEQEGRLDMSKVRFNERVMSLDQTDGDRVQITTHEGSTYDAEFVILTSTIGVLQNNGLIFEPALPPWKTEEIFRYKMATIDTIFMQFEEKFWDDTEYIGHIGERMGYFTTFFNWEAPDLLPAGTNILSTFLTGEEAYRAELMTDEEVKAEILEILQTIYGAAVSECTGFYMSRFATDENLYGNFASWPIGTVPEDSRMRLTAPVGRIYFAPEDAGSEYIGIPAGSIKTGQAAAKAVAACCKNDICDEYVPEMPVIPPLCIDVKPDNPKKFRKMNP